ncbi:triple tyrosine motif-containing protein [Stenotrophomonas sp. HITSZ_GD]|uniref:sensor histidine kinase n=1 Tax=Stenotrophomonas sp. HITSZ_GD TaxID=3037248 RepID=UPI00240D6994|nr:sensor histidine kinase [Stenotrophomonas sp. HITSZ_GD]MDG2524140.1 triple tyrosine motif-containing protein [Stenotrophomonas sp. HITSZ_GD]
MPRVSPTLARSLRVAAHALCAAAALTLASPNARADDGAPAVAAGIAGYDHAAWPVERGAPGDIWDIAQAADGALWLATGAGLYRFDGRVFTRQEAPAGTHFLSGNMTTLRLEPDGTLWIGYYNAGLSRLAGDRLDHYQPAQGMPTALLPRLARDAAGRLWAASDGGLRWFDGHAWRAPAPAMGDPGAHAQWLLRDRHGTLWVSNDEELLRLRRGTQRFEATGVAVSRFSSLAESPSGELWLADRQRGLMPVARGGAILPEAERLAGRLPQVRANRVLFARDGSLWASGLQGGGVYRVRFADDAPPRVEQFAVAQGLSSPYPAPLLEDREGNIWVGTNLGLDRFRAHSVHRLGEPHTGGDPLQTLYQAPDGAVYAYTEDMQPLRLDRDTLARLAGAQPPQPPAPGARIWMSGLSHVALWHAGRLDARPLPDLPDRRYLHAMASDGDRQAWACFGDDYVYRHDGQRWARETRLPHLACTTVVLQGDAALFGYQDGSVRVLEGGRVTTYGPAQGLAVGPVTMLYRDAQRLIVAGETGVAARGADGRFHALQARGGNLLDGVNGIVRDASDQYWLYGARGLLRIDAADLAQAVTHDAPLRAPRLFDAIDGLPGISRQASPVPTAVLGAEGLLWLASNQGLAWLDTRQPHRNPIAPQVHIGEIAYGGSASRPLHEGLVLPQHTTQLQIDYAAASLARPDRVRYRYRLAGLERDWHDAGELTRASYSNLGPGQYRFEAEAGNEDGVWSAAPATRSFRIAPAFTQTVAFKVLCVALGLGVLALAVRARARQLGARLRARLDERHQERERIARELHDTLLQGTQGLILRLHAASQRLPAGDPLRAELEAAMDLAEQAMAEGRERVRGLRGPVQQGQDLGAALLQVRDDAGGAVLPQVRLLVEGEPRPLLPHAAEELYMIGREALLNAFQHAHAQAVEIEVGYARRALRLRIRDDGRGLSDAATQQAGHWGLHGMRERAARLGARLQVWSRVGAGTEIQISLPAVRAYRRPARRRGHAWLRAFAFTRGEA